MQVSIKTKFCDINNLTPFYSRQIPHYTSVIAPRYHTATIYVLSIRTKYLLLKTSQLPSTSVIGNNSSISLLDRIPLGSRSFLALLSASIGNRFLNLSCIHFLFSSSSAITWSKVNKPYKI